MVHAGLTVNIFSYVTTIGCHIGTTTFGWKVVLEFGRKNHAIREYKEVEPPVSDIPFPIFFL